MEIYVGFGQGLAGDNTIARLQHQYHQECYEQDCEAQSVDQHLATHTCRKVLVSTDIVDKVHCGHGACEEENSKAKQQVFPTGNRLETMRRSPLRDNGAAGVEDVGACHCKCAAKEQCAHGHTQEHAAEKPVEHQEAVVNTCAVDISLLAAKFIADGLEYETEQYKHPKPVCTTETGAVEQGE